MPALGELLNPVHSPEKKSVLEAIASKGPRIVPADIAATTGLALPLVMMELNSIASETNAHLEVTERGEIAYTFARNLQESYIANASRHVFRSAMRVIANASLIFMRAFAAFMFLVVRISFGVVLILGVVAVVVIIIAAVIAMMSQRGDRDRDDGGLPFDFDFSGLFDFGWHGGYYHRPVWAYWILDWLWDWVFYWRYVIPGPVTAPTDPDGARGKKKPGGNFLLDVFTYLFGQENPNEGFDEMRWQVVAQVIKANQGVVVAEQLAPYLSDIRERGQTGDEDWMIKVLQRFNGIPEVSEKGNIIYSFPAFQSVQSDDPAITGGRLMAGSNADSDLSQLYRQHLSKQNNAKRAEQHARNLDGYLLENNWEYMPLKAGSLTTIIIFGLIVLFGSGLLLVNAWHLVMIEMLRPLLWVLFGYGVMFFAVPAVRYPIFKAINQKIDARNKIKLDAAQALRAQAGDLGTKIEEARQARVTGEISGKQKVVYTTQKDALDQEDDLSAKFAQLEKNTPAQSNEQLDFEPQPNAGDDLSDGGVIDISKLDIKNKKKEMEDR
ncbi:MAG: hypothetical protein K2X70_01400 [Candidatus Obscuribacterales bacterium]|nr:hypothetical protein [Candidatus Obscuribacterales bacterium]